MEEKYLWFNNYHIKVQPYLMKLASLIRKKPYSHVLDILQGSTVDDEGQSKWIVIKNIIDNKNLYHILPRKDPERKPKKYFSIYRSPYDGSRPFIEVRKETHLSGLMKDLDRNFPEGSYNPPPRSDQGYISKNVSKTLNIVKGIDRKTEGIDKKTDKIYISTRLNRALNSRNPKKSIISYLNEIERDRNIDEREKKIWETEAISALEDLKNSNEKKWKKIFRGILKALLGDLAVMGFDLLTEWIENRS